MAKALSEVNELHAIEGRKPRSYQIMSQIPNLRKKRREDLLSFKTVGFVPTMGALHQGHLSLIRQAAKENHRVYVSIYVNPTQFGVNEDLSSYPRPWAADQVQLIRLVDEFNKDDRMGQITVVFAPRTNEMYPGLPPTSEINGDGSFVTITPLSSRLEGASRPVFFRGVATVCMKLLNIVQPDKVYFGQKDIQQAVIIKRMVEDFHINTEVRLGPTVRENDGLAMSSRNVYLGSRRRLVAPVLLKAFKAAQKAFADGKRKRSDLMTAALEITSTVQEQQRSLAPSKRANFDVDYFSVADPKSMIELDEVTVENGAILSGAIKMLPVESPQPDEDVGLGGGKSVVRLIDNIRLDILTAKMGIIPTEI